MASTTLQDNKPDRRTTSLAFINLNGPPVLILNDHQMPPSLVPGKEQLLVIHPLPHVPLAMQLSQPYPWPKPSIHLLTPMLVLLLTWEYLGV